MSLGRNLTILLYDHRMSKNELAERVGVSPSMISKTLLGVKTPSVEKCAKIAEVFGITLDELIK